MSNQLIDNNFTGSAYTRHLGIEYQSAENGKSRLVMKLQECHSNLRGHAHGGALFSLVDASMGIAVFTKLPERMSTVTIECKINYTKAVSTGTLTCDAQVVHLGTRTVVVEAAVTCEGELIAKAQGTFALVSVREK